MIKITNLNKYYFKNKKNEIHVLNNISLELPDKGLITFLGTSGSGKTTLLNVIGGLDNATGDIEFDNLKLNGMKSREFDLYRQRKIGYIFQNYNLLSNLTVHDNLKAELDIIGVTDFDEQEKRIEYCLKAVGLFNTRKKMVNALSGGQQQRVSIARALVKESKVIIADEPTGNLDSTNSLEIMNILKNLSDKTLIILVTHNNKLAYEYSDQIYKLKDGQLSESFETSDKVKDYDTGAVYLNELENLKINSYGVAINLYTDSKIPNLDIRIIYHNNKFYFDANQNIQGISDSKLVVLENREKVEVKKTEFDNSFYLDKKAKISPKYLKNMFVNDYNLAMNSNKHNLLTKLSLFFIGLFFSLSLILFSISTKKYHTDEPYNATYDTLVNEGDDLTLNIMREALIQNYVTNLVAPIESTVSYQRNITYNRSISASFNYVGLPYSEDHVKLKAGEEPKLNDVVISQSMIEEISKTYGIDYNEKDIIGTKVAISTSRFSGQYTVSGISKNDSQVYYFNESSYSDMLFKNDLQGLDYVYNSSLLEYSTGEKVYQVVKGRDVYENSFSGRPEVLVNDEDFAVLPKELKLNGYIYTVVGSYSYPIKVESMYISNYGGTVTSKLNVGYTAEENYFITEGRKPENAGEILVCKLFSNMPSLKIGNKLSGFTIVGYFLGNSEANYFTALGEYEAAICSQFKDTYLFDTLDKTAMTSSDVKITNWVTMKTASPTQAKTYLIASTAIIAISAVMVYFIFRGNLSFERNELSVLRSLGKTKGSIIKDKLKKTAILSTMTNLIGYVSIVILYQLGSFLLSNRFPNWFGTINGLLIFEGYLIMMVVVFVFSLLPYLLMLRKSPIDLIRDYDI